MPEFPVVTGNAAVKAFERLGFVLDRQEGSHKILKKPGHQFHLSVPCHRGKKLGRGLLKSLIRAAGVTVEAFQEAL